MNQIEMLQKLIDESQHLVFFGGAGVSTESNILDFRSKDGLYHLKSKYGLPYEEMLSSQYFYSHPRTFYQFYKEFMINLDAKPNMAHCYLAKKEKEGKDITIITQNIDNLHQEAGSKHVIELHGSIKRNYCLKCHQFVSLETLLSLDNPPLCPKCQGSIKPDVVLYGEALDENVLIEAITSLEKADLLIIAGTSLKVYPAAGLINYFHGNNIVIINKEPLSLNGCITLNINSKIGEVFSQLK